MTMLLKIFAIGGVAAIMAAGTMPGTAWAANAAPTDGVAVAQQTGKSKLSYPVPLILCRPHQTCPP